MFHVRTLGYLLGISLQLPHLRLGNRHQLPGYIAIYICIYVCICANTYNLHICTYMYICMYSYVCLPYGHSLRGLRPLLPGLSTVHRPKHIDVCIYVYIYIYRCICMYIHIYKDTCWALSAYDRIATHPPTPINLS